VWAPGGQPRVVFGLTIRDGRITAIDMQADPRHVAAHQVQLLGS